MATDDIYEDDESTLTLFPPGTVIFEPDPIHQVIVQFPDENSAIFFVEWCKQVCINGNKRNAGGDGSGSGDGSDGDDGERYDG